MSLPIWKIPYKLTVHYVQLLLVLLAEIKEVPGWQDKWKDSCRRYISGNQRQLHMKSDKGVQQAVIVLKFHGFMKAGTREIASC